MRLIDADALKKKVRNECLMSDWCHVLIDVAIANSPTIEERKTGNWIRLDKDNKFFVPHMLRCSECGNILDKHGVNAGRGDANYCPNCGADMRGEE